MNWKYFISKTLCSPASAPRPAPTQPGPASVLSDLCVLCVSKFFHNPLTPSSLNPLLLLLTLSLLSSFTSYAWDDDDDTDSKPFHRSNYNQQSSAIDYGYKNNNQQNSSIDYGYKNPYQVNSTHRS